MATFGQWLKRHPEPKKRIYYICGQQRELVEEVVESVKASHPEIPVWERCYLLGTDSNATVMAALNQELTGPARLVLIRDAEKLGCWPVIMDWIGTMPDTTLILVTNEANPRKGPHPEYFRVIAKAGRFVECKGMSEKQAHAYIRSQLKISDEALALLLDRCLSVSRLIQEISKLALYEGEIDVAMVGELVVQEEISLFYDAVMAKRLQAALRHIPTDDSERRGAIGLLRANLVGLIGMVSAKGYGLSVRDLGVRFKINQVMAARLWRLASRIRLPEAIGMLRYVASAQRRVEEGVEIGVLERLACELCGR